MSDAMYELRCLNSLAKVLAHQEPDSRYELAQATMLSNEVFSFQVAYRSEKLLKGVKLAIATPLSNAVMIRHVGLAPSELTMYGNHDGYILSEQPGLYPDPLMPVEAGGAIALPRCWGSFWVTVDLRGQSQSPGSYPVDFSVSAADGTQLGSASIQLEVLSASLPEQKLIRTEWFHTDCLANHYQVDVFSEEHWRRIEQYVETAVKQGVNMLLTPLFTPPLDTEVGGERTTVQLVEVERDGQSYRFHFALLEQWIALGERCGVRYYEFSHLFTQWGAQYAPKIMATEQGKLTRIFGWETDASGEEYGKFLEAFLPELDRFIQERGLGDRVFFHVSDEPSVEQLESYRTASSRLSRFLGRYPTFDALSDYEFYAHGLVNTPVVANNHIDEFISRGVDNLWAYYCCSQFKLVSNRFFVFPSERNRIIGFQLYKFKIKGFLHWGYNFWYSQYARKMLNPFVQTDADRAFPSGDAFLVYPGEDGPIESIRMVVFYEALQDLRALEKLESLIGRDNTLNLIEENLLQPLTFSEYPHDPQWLIGKREQINQLIATS